MKERCRYSWEKAEQAFRRIQAALIDQKQSIDALSSDADFNDAIREILNLFKYIAESRAPGYGGVDDVAVKATMKLLKDCTRATSRSAAEFRVIASKKVRQTLCDELRAENAQKRGGNATILSIDDYSEQSKDHGSWLSRPDHEEALAHLVTSEKITHRQLRVYRGVYLEGYTQDEMADSVRVCRQTASSDLHHVERCLVELLKQPEGSTCK